MKQFVDEARHSIPPDAIDVVTQHHTLSAPLAEIGQVLTRATRHEHYALSRLKKRVAPASSCGLFPSAQQDVPADHHEGRPLTHFFGTAHRAWPSKSLPA
ncbi:MAG: hypothetical protein AAGD43_05740 [Pseudomonadota bacterium]